jgi:hypothetical protein
METIKEWKDEIRNSTEFVEAIRRELLGKRVFVFLRDGKILNLSRGATVIDAAWCDCFERNGIHVGVSMDGPAFLHDAHRVTRTGLPTHAAVMRGIDWLARRQIPFQVICVLTADEIDFADPIGIGEPATLVLAVLAEVVAPIFIAAGLWTRWAAIPVAATMAQLYLLNARTLMTLADSVEGDAKTRARIRFAVQQWVDATSPSNYLAFNPEALKKAVETQGESIGKGLQHLRQRWLHLTGDSR